MAMVRRNPDGAIVILGGAALAALIVAILAARPARAAPENETGQKLDYLADLAEAQVQQLQRLVEIGEQLIGEVPIVLEPKIVPGLVSVPLDPEILNRAIQAVTPLGKARFGTTRGAVLCPAGVTTTWTHYMMTNYYCTDREIYFSADFYDPLIVVNIYVDDHLVTPFGIQLTGPGPLNFGDYYVKKRKVDVVAVNATATDCLISSHWTWTSLEKSFYDEFYRPILDFMYRSLEEVARGQV